MIHTEPLKWRLSMRQKLCPLKPRHLITINNQGLIIRAVELLNSAARTQDAGSLWHKD